MKYVGENALKKIFALIKGVTDAKQDTANKVTSVTSWQATPDDTHYPSEKLVKDELDDFALEMGDKMENTDAECFSSFSMGRRSGSTAPETGDNSVAVGSDVAASGDVSVAEGSWTHASGEASHAEGASTTANGVASHSEGLGTYAGSNYQHVQGQYNVSDSSDVYADIIGAGSGPMSPKNIEATTWTGDKRLKGNVYVGCNNDSTGGSILATQSYVDGLVGNVESLLSDLR